MVNATQKKLELDTAPAPKPAAWSKHQEEDGLTEPAKRRQKRREKEVQYAGFRPGEPVAMRHEISEWAASATRTIWIAGYEVHDLEVPGASAQRQRKSQMGWVPIVRAGEHESRAVFLQPERLERIVPGKRYAAFGDVYAQSSGGAEVGKVEKGEVVELNDRENEALIRETIIREAL